MMTAMMFPNAERAMRKLRAREAPEVPKTTWKKREAASSVELLSAALSTVSLRVRIHLDGVLVGLGMAYRPRSRLCLLGGRGLLLRGGKGERIFGGS